MSTSKPRRKPQMKRCVYPYNNYFADRPGNIYDENRDLVDPFVEYVMYELKDVNGTRRRQSGHRLVLGAYKNIGHKHHDRIENLESLSPSDHAKQTQLDNPQIKAALHAGDHGQKVESVDVQDGSVVKFDSWTEAANAANELSGGKLRGVELKCNYAEKQIPYCGRMWHMQNLSLPGERWYTTVAPPANGARDFRGLSISSLGRALINKMPTLGYKAKPDDPTWLVRWKGQTCTAAQAVCTAWHGPKPEEGAFVARWNGDTSDNHPSNLRWASGSSHHSAVAPPPRCWAVDDVVINPNEVRARAAEKILTLISSYENIQRLEGEDAFATTFAACDLVMRSSVDYEADLVKVFKIGHIQSRLLRLNKVLKHSGMRAERASRVKLSSDYSILHIHELAADTVAVVPRPPSSHKY